MPRKSNDTVAVLGIDIGKNVFHFIGLNKRGTIVLRQKLSRGQLEARLANMPPCLIGMEACVGAHHLSRTLKALGHDPRLMPAKYVKAFLKGNKNDFRDAEAIAEAVQRPTMRFVATKTAEQLDLQALHRVRSRLVSERTAIKTHRRSDPAGGSAVPLPAEGLVHRRNPSVCARIRHSACLRVLRICV
jgi:transposase